MELRRKIARKEAKQRRKPLKDLSTLRNLTANAQADTTANATESPLLRLPAEVRNAIYRLVLGDKVLHVDVDHLGVSGTHETRRHMICQASQSPREIADRIIKDRSEVGGASIWQDKHVMCNSVNSPHELFSLSLLRVCRQIHSDAALIPLETNTFAFDQASSIANFVDQMVSEQRKAIGSICIFKSKVENGFGGFPRIDLLKKLTGLRHLTILANVPGPYFGPEALHRQVSNVLLKATGDLKYVGWETVAVCVTVSPASSHSMRRNVAGFDAFRPACREMERALLEYGDYEAELQRRKEKKKREWEEGRLERKRQQEEKIEASKERRRRKEARESEAKRRQEARIQAEDEKKRKSDEKEARRNAKMAAEETKLNVKNAHRTQRGMREVKVARYSA